MGFDNSSLNSFLDCKRIIFALMAISIITMLVYSNNYSASWHFDDEHNILDRTEIHLNKLDWSEIKKPLFKGKWLWRPVSCLSLAVNYYFNGTKVFGYHLINNLIHLTSAIFLFFFIYLTLNLPILQKRYREDAYSIALMATVFWAINPVQTQAVTYIVQRMASMAGMFYIMAMYFYLKWRTSYNKHLRIVFFILSVSTALLAFGSKENSLLLLPVLFLYEILLIRGVFTKEQFLKSIKFFIGSILFVLFLAFVYLYFIKGGNASSLIKGYDHRTFTLIQRLLTEPRIILFYISLLLYPIPSRLSVNHDIPLSYSLFNPPSTFLALLLIVCLIMGAILISKKRPLIAFCILFFFLNHLVESTFIPLELAYEHRNYIPSMLLFIPIATLFIKTIAYFSEKKLMKSIIAIFFTFIIISFGHSTFFRNFIWQTEEILWLDNIKKYPELLRPHYNLATYYQKTNRIPEAIDEYRIAISKDRKNNTNDEIFAYYNLGLIYYRLKKEDKALFYFNEAERINPYYAPTYMGRGALYLEQGMLDEALSEFNKAFEYDRNISQYHGNIGFLYLLMGEIDEAIYNLELAIKKYHNNSITYRHLGQAYREKELFSKALTMFNRSLYLSPDNPLTLLHLIELYSTLGMASHVDENLNKFFNSFRGNEKNLKSFLIELLDGKGIDYSNKLLATKRMLISKVAAGCRERGQVYMDIAEYLSIKKGLTEPPVLSDEKPN